MSPQVNGGEATLVLSELLKVLVKSWSPVRVSCWTGPSPVAAGMDSSCLRLLPASCSF